MPHIHVGLVEFLTTGLYLLIFSFIWRALAARLATRDGAAGTAGRAMSAVFS